MGFRHLGLVSPPPEWIHEARPMACQAGDVIERAPVYSNIAAALESKSLVVGTSRRTGKERGLFLPFEQGLDRIRKAAAGNPVGILFGREPSGLSNRELESCGFVISIPSAPGFPSLNLAQSVMLVLYELFRSGVRPPEDSADELVGHAELAGLYRRMRTALERLGYENLGDRDLAASILRDLRRIFSRAGLTTWELHMLTGLCRRIEQKIPREPPSE